MLDTNLSNNTLEGESGESSEDDGVTHCESD
jgi:hypothetical protein